MKIASLLLAAALLLSACSDDTKARLDAAAHPPEAEIVSEPATEGPSSTWRIERWWWIHFISVHGITLDSFLAAKCGDENPTIDVVVPAFDPDARPQYTILQIWKAGCAEDAIVALKAKMDGRKLYVIFDQAEYQTRQKRQSG